MRISKSATYALSALAAAALLAACSGNSGSQSYGPSGSSVTSPMGSHHQHMPNHKFPTLTALKTTTVHPDHHKSWVSPDVAKAPRVLFISDYGNGDVYIYTMPGMALKGTLTGFSGNQGECTDGSGNIWITNTNTQQIFKYSRTGTLLSTLDDAGFYPVGCAVNRSNGDLAVSNIIGSAGDGNVEIYANGSGSGSPVSNPNQSEYFFPAYDTSGNLYVDGFDNSGFFTISQCSGSTCSSMNISGASPDFPGGLSWDRVNSQLVIGDQECGGNLGSCVYGATISGTTATITSTTDLPNYDGTNCDVDQGTLAPFSKYFAGGCIPDSTTASADRWGYPAGGTPNNHATGQVEPIGAAISNK
jgi:hypothetical protein